MVAGEASPWEPAGGLPGEDAEPVNGEAAVRGRGRLVPGGGGAAGNLEVPLNLRNDFFSSTVSAV